MKYNKEVPLGCCGSYGKHNSWRTFFFLTVKLYDQKKKQKKKDKVQYKADTSQQFLPLASQFRFSMKCKGISCDRHSNT